MLRLLRRCFQDQHQIIPPAQPPLHPFALTFAIGQHPASPRCPSALAVTRSVAITSASIVPSWRRAVALLSAIRPQHVVPSADAWGWLWRANLAHRHVPPRLSSPSSDAWRWACYPDDWSLSFQYKCVASSYVGYSTGTCSNVIVATLHVVRPIYVAATVLVHVVRVVRAARVHGCGVLRAVPACAPSRQSAVVPFFLDPFPSTVDRPATTAPQPITLERSYLLSPIASKLVAQRTLFGASLFPIIPHFRRLLDPRHRRPYLAYLTRNHKLAAST